MDAVNDPRIENIVFMSAAQVGKSEILLNTIFYYIDCQPSSMLMLQPTVEMAQNFSRTRIQPSIAITPAIKAKVPDPKTRDSGNTILHKEGPGWTLDIAGSNSPASLSSRPIRILLLDEVDRMPLSAGSEGDPVNLAKKRTSTFANRKILMVSTPTVKTESRIAQAYEESDQRKFHVPCGKCKKHQVLKWKQVRWKDDDPRSARYRCEFCGDLWTDHGRNRAVKQGKWIADFPERPVAGFWVNALYSPWVKMHELVTEFLEAKHSGSTEQLQTFTNLVLAETWEESGERIEDVGLYARRESWAKVPDKVLVVTAGVDVQDDRLELSFVGFGKDEESWVLSHEIIWADPSTPGCWDALDAMLGRSFKRQDGAVLNVSRACVDSGGHFTQMVYAYCQRSRVAIAIKGQYGNEDDPIIRRPSKQAGRVQLVPVTTNKIKALLYFRLQRADPGPGFVHFHDSLDEEWFQQLTSEVMRRTFQRGKLSYTFKKIRPRNEALDCVCYSIAALALLNVRDWGVLEKKRADSIEKPKKPAPRSRRNWVTNW